MTKNKVIIPWTCSECGVQFDTPRGGVCPGCDALLCGKHYWEHYEISCSGIDPKDWFEIQIDIEGDNK